MLRGYRHGRQADLDIRDHVGFSVAACLVSNVDWPGLSTLGSEMGEGNVPGRRLSFLVACIGGIVAIVAAAVWLASRSDAILARWSAIAGVISVVVAVLALVAAVVPLWRHDDDGGRPGREPGTVVTQKIKSRRGRVNAAGRDQFNIDIGRRPDDKG
jgi:hypothetical protein